MYIVFAFSVTPSLLKEVQLQVYPNEECKTRGIPVSDGMLCAGKMPNALVGDACQVTSFALYTSWSQVDKWLSKFVVSLPLNKTQGHRSTNEQ